MNDMSNPPSGGSGQLYLQALQGIVQAINALISPLTNVVQKISGISVLGNSGTAAATAAPIIGTAAQVLRVNDAGTALAFGQVDLAQSAAVTGLLPLANVTNGTSGYALIGNGASPSSYQGFLQSGAGAVTRTWQSKVGEVAVSVVDFGATGNGSTDDTTAIQNAINSLPATGGRVFFPAGNYKITSTLTIGNGTSSAFSTRSGVILMGEGMPTAELDSDTSPTRLVWAGAASAAMISINGPLRGWGVQNLLLAGQNTAGVRGLKITSGMHGDSRNIIMKGVCRGVESVTFDKTGGLAGVSNVDSTQNIYSNLRIELHDQATTAPAAVLLTSSGNSTVTSNTDFNVFTGLAIDVDGNVNASFGVYLQCCDGCTFHNVHCSPGSGATNFTAVNFAYSDVNTSFPNSCKFFGVDPGAANKMAASGTAAVGDNVIYGLMKGNGGNVQTLSGVSYV